MADHNFGTFLPLTDCATMLTSVLTTSFFGSSVEDDSLNDLPSISSPSSLEVSHEDPPDNSNIVDVCLESQMAVKNFLLYFKCDFWMAQIPFCVSLPQLSTSPGELTFKGHTNILECCKPLYKNMKVYFNPVKYPAVTKDNVSGFIALHKDLEVLALNNGFLYEIQWWQ